MKMISKVLFFKVLISDQNVVCVYLAERLVGHSSTLISDAKEEIQEI